MSSNKSTADQYSEQYKPPNEERGERVRSRVSEEGRKPALNRAVIALKGRAAVPDLLPELLPAPAAVPNLGEPLDIRSVGKLIGCSAWNVRQRLMPQGLPHYRSGPTGKLIFYHDQVVRWILQQQLKGGMSRGSL